MKNRLVRSVAFLGVLAIGVLAISQVALAQGLDTPNPQLPPEGVYLTAEDVHARYTGTDLEIVLEDPIHKPVVQELQINDLPGGTEEEIFFSELTGNVTLVPGGPVGPVFLSGMVTTHVLNKVGNSTGTFDTEIISMSLSGNIAGMPVQIREDPDRPSTGSTTITTLGGGMYHIDSFFDVFTELSVNDGTGWSPWIPSTGGPRMTLAPEPGSLSLLGIGLVGLLACLWRRKRAV